ncbi:hypothetical protein PILCRDRAFT_810162 [Piloderma croceum F 1598]|uniref:Uncharacterized protein n=1 Tax=Piloderma croceum (strain F 1598) TaxID=765440 RepID=A0A0C3G7G6_PILCF|nr:hypothetical protein PILCRDRAFT_810162 [Piloderma croceum F 1598]
MSSLTPSSRRESRRGGSLFQSNDLSPVMFFTAAINVFSAWRTPGIDSFKIPSYVLNSV